MAPEEDSKSGVEEAVELLKRYGPLTPAELAKELGCTKTVAFRQLTLVAQSRKWGAFIYQRDRGGDRRPLQVEFLFYDPRAVTANVELGVRNLQEQMFRLEAKFDALLARLELGAKDS
jgi:hypothetical protein